MGVRDTTTEGKTALFDSTSNVAFGPVFDDAVEAQDFLDWLTEGSARGLTFGYGQERLLVLEDPRKYREGELERLVYVFREEQEEAEGA